jgi:hypothetical protein
LRSCVTPRLSSSPLAPGCAARRLPESPRDPACALRASDGLCICSTTSFPFPALLRQRSIRLSGSANNWFHRDRDFCTSRPKNTDSLLPSSSNR